MNVYFDSNHCKTAKKWTVMMPSVVNRYPAIYVISCVGEKNG